MSGVEISGGKAAEAQEYQAVGSCITPGFISTARHVKGKGKHRLYRAINRMLHRLIEDLKPMKRSRVRRVVQNELLADEQWQKRFTDTRALGWVRCYYRRQHKLGDDSLRSASLLRASLPERPVPVNKG